MITGKKAEMICDVLEAIEKMREYKPLYEIVLKMTGDKKQAIATVKFVIQMEKEIADANVK